MEIKQAYELWKEKTVDNAELSADLSGISEEEIFDRFYCELEFGTAGLRGVLGAGTNRMNIYTVARASAGIAAYLLSGGDKKRRSVAIAYDSRNNSELFAKTSAAVYAGAGIKVFLYPYLMPTPALSYAVRNLGCDAGVVITASHNPAKYNGYKAYGPDGCQITEEAADKILAEIAKASYFAPIADFDALLASGDIEYISDEIIGGFIADAVACAKSPREGARDLKLVYTPLNGAGRMCVTKALDMCGFTDVTLVSEQTEPDGNFPTCPYPNPEIREALQLGLDLMQKTGADLLLATDPDCDRVGTAVLHNGEYVLITGNQIGALLVDFVLSHKKDVLNEKSTLVKTIVTSEVGADIARSYGLHIVDTLTGFKYIGEQIGKYEVNGDKEFVIGYEESYGYLVGTHARDKDAVVSSMLICQMAAYHKNNGRTLIDALNNIYAKFGFYLDALDTFVLKGKDGAEKIQSIMTNMRENGQSLFDNIKNVLDYSKGIDDLPKENVLKYTFTDGSWMAVRPSGTEPKLKVYYSMCGETREAATEKLEKVRAILKKEIEA